MATLHERSNFRLSRFAATHESKSCDGDGPAELGAELEFLVTQS